MKKVLFILTLFIASFSISQWENDEIAIGFGLGKSNLGGNFSANLKYNLPKVDSTHAYGPMFRWQRGWSNNVGIDQQSSFNIWGPGAFYHYRFADVLFAGIEFEYLSTPFSYTLLSPTSNWVPILNLGAGYSQSFDFVRVNLGFFYDIIDNDNSPMRPQYFIKQKNEAGDVTRILPVIYKLQFFFPLGN